MGEEKLKKLLAGLGIATLVSAAGVSLPPPANAASGWGSKDDSAVSTDKEQQPAGSGWGGQTDGAVSTDDEKKPAGSGWGGHTDGAVGTDEEKEPGDSGW